MAATALILILVVLVAVIIVELIYKPFNYKLLICWSLIIFGSLLGIIVAAIIVSSLAYFYKRKRDNVVQECCGRTLAFAENNPTAEIPKHSDCINITNQNSIVLHNPICRSCQCYDGQHTPQQKMISPTVNQNDTQCYTPMDGRQLKEVQTERFNAQPWNISQLESYC